ncbi:MAG: hypothetical protein V1712_00030 [Patescibacteria group bacterium]
MLRYIKSSLSTLKLIQEITMKILGIVMIVLLFFPLIIGAQESSATEFLAGGQAWLNFRHRAFKVAGTSRFINESFVGDFSFEGQYALVKAPLWSLNLGFGIQNLYGGFQERRAIIYAVCYSIDLNWIYALWPDKLDLTLSAFHQSTHLADPIEPKTPAEILELSSITIDVEDVNLFRFGLTLKNHDNFWSGGLQPIRLKYFLFAEPREMFKSASYERYKRRLYFDAGYTGWRSSNHRLAIYLTGETEIDTRYTIKLQYSTKLQNDMRFDRWQIFLAYEGGMGKQTVAVTPYSGLTREWWFVGGKIFF